MPKSLESTSTQSLGDLSVEVDYKFYPGERQTYHEPGTADEVELISVRFSIDTESGEIPLDCITDACQDRWIEKICEEVNNALAEGPEEDVSGYDYPEEL